MYTLITCWDLYEIITNEITCFINIANFNLLWIPEKAKTHT